MSLARFYPLRGLPNQGQIWSWISFDVANQSFTLIINTLLFPVFFEKIVARGSAHPSTLWSIVTAASMLLVVLASPVAGAVADERSWKKAALLVTGFSCAVMTCLLGVIQPDQVWLAALIYIPANFMFSIGENFLASFLPVLARREDFGRVSGFSWAVAYGAALVLLVLTAGTMMLLGLQDPDRWRPFFVLSGVWFFAFTIPTLVVLREPRGAATHAARNVWTVGFVRLAESLRRVKEYRDLARLLVASLFYGAGMNVIIFFASILAVQFGFKDEALVVFVAVITVSGIVGTLLPTYFQDRLGHKRTTILLLLVWLVTAGAFALFAHLRLRSPGTVPAWPLWIFGNLIGFGLGSLGSANRAFVGYFTPESRTAEVFGLWGMVFKLAAVLVVPFALVKDRLGTPASLLVLAGFILIGLLITLSVDERRGAEAARGGTGAG
ncbi:MAG: MFS transporter [Phycisphaerae bacterium]|nr:MAG: MFS transporter [Phycisphaerae bacterium]